MRHHDDQLVCRDLLQDLHDLHRGLRIQRARRLVGQQDIGIIDQGARDGHALHLSAGKLVGLFVDLIAESDLFQRLRCAASALGFAHARDRQRQLHVGEHALMRDQIVGLKDKTNRMIAIGVPIGVGVVLR